MENIIPSLIVFEGLDGSGKSTQAGLLAKDLSASGRRTVLTAEPTDRPIGRLVRQVLRGEVRTSPRALALLYAADRSDHLMSVRSWCESGNTVIADRYFYSSMAYQGVSEDMDFLRLINAYPHAEKVIFVDTPAEECMRRIDDRGGEKELFDRIEYLEKVRKNFKLVFSGLPDYVSFLEVDGLLPVEEQRRIISAFISR